MICRRLRFFLLALCAMCLPALVQAQTYPPAWSSSASYAVGDQVQLNGNVIRAVKAVAPGSFKYADWELWQVRASSTYMVGVGQTFTSIRTAWFFIQNARIADGAYVHLYLSSQKSSFNEVLPSAFNLDHAFGAKISIIADNTSDTITFNGNGSDGFVIDSGHSFAALTNVGITGTFNAGAAIHASANSVISSMTAISIAGFDRGVEADTGASLTCASSVTFTNVTAFDFGAIQGGIISVGFGFSSSHSVGEVFFATTGGEIIASNPVLQYATVAGAYAVDGGLMDISGANISHCADGVQADQTSRILVEDSTFSTNTIDIVSNHGSTVDAVSGTYTTTSALNGAQIF